MERGRRPGLAPLKGAATTGLGHENERRVNATKKQNEGRHKVVESFSDILLRCTSIPTVPRTLSNLKTAVVPHYLIPERQSYRLAETKAGFPSSGIVWKSTRGWP